MKQQPLAATLARIERSTGALATQSVARMDDLLPWFRAMPPDQRSWITLVAQAGVSGFVHWLRHPGDATSPITEVFGTAPPELARAVSLQQTVDLVRVTVEVVEERVPTLAAPGEETALREAVLRYSREIAFAAAEVYAGVAETRGAWDARLEALVVDALLRGDDDGDHDDLHGRVAAIGWGAVRDVAVVVGTAPDGPTESVIDVLRHAARPTPVRLLAGVHGHRLIVVLGNAPKPAESIQPLLAGFASGPVICGPVVPDLAFAGRSAAEATSALQVAAAWPGLPRPAGSDQLLPERALAGDVAARESLIEDAYRPLLAAGNSLAETVDAYFDSGGRLESTARVLYVHPNTVRYRLRRVAEVTGRAPTDARDAFALQIAVALGRLQDAAEPDA